MATVPAGQPDRPTRQGRSRSGPDVTVRFILSYLLTLQATVDLDDPMVAQDYARRYLGSMLSAFR